MAIADITKPMALDETLQGTNTALENLNTTNGSLAKDASLNTTETTPRNIADVLADELGRITNLLKPDADDVDYDNTSSGLSATNVQDAIDEIKAGIDETGATKTESSTTNGNIKIDNVETPIYRNYGNNTVLTTDKTPFLTRQTLNPTGFSGYVREKLVGASYAWNNVCSGYNNYSLSATATTAEGNLYYRNIGTVVSSGVLIVGHKYFVRIAIRNASANFSKFNAYFNNYTSGISASRNASAVGIINITDASTTLTRFYATDQNTCTANIDVQVTDLTLAFGSTIADYLYNLADNGGITKLRDMGFPIDKYTDYGYGLYSSKPSGKKVRCKNMLDESNYRLDYTYPQYFCLSASKTNATWLPAGKYKVILNNPYTNSRIWGALSSVNSEDATWKDIWGDGHDSSNRATTNYTFTITEPKYFFVVFGQVNSGWGSVSIQMAQDANAMVYDYNKYNGDDTYEEPSITTYSLGSTELRGHLIVSNGEIVAEGDVRESNGGIERNWVRLNLGDYNYTRISTSGIYVFIPTLTNVNIKKGCNGICAKYVFGNYPYVVANDKSFWVHDSTANTIYIRDDGYTDATAFKTAMNGVYMDVELATPTTETSTPFADPMSMVGATTEEYIDTRDIPCPVGAERQYMGQSEDIVEIPSTPQSDGVWVQKCYVSGGKAQYVWELES